MNIKITMTKVGDINNKLTYQQILNGPNSVYEIYEHNNEKVHSA